MIDFAKENDWGKIKNDVMLAVPTIPAGQGQYNAWLARVGNFRQAGFSLEEVQTWCGVDGNLTEEKFNQAPGSEDELAARKILFAIAKKNGLKVELAEPAKKIQWFYPPLTEENKKIAIENAIQVFSSMYEPDSLVYICNGRFDKKQNKITPDGGSITSVKVGDMTPEVLAGLLQFDKGMYIQYNTVDTDKFNEHKAEKPLGSITKDHIADFKYYYIEVDPPEGEDPKEFAKKSVEKLETLDLPWVAHVFSGNKSIHTIIRLDASNEDEFKNRLSHIHNYCKKCGYEVDSAVKNTARWGRFPCCKRGNNFQYVMAVNDSVCSFADWAARHTQPTQISTSKLLDAKGNIDSASMLDFIHSLGFASCIDGDDATLVQIDGKMVERIKPRKMIGVVNEAIKATEPNILSKSQVFLGGKSANYFGNLPFVDIATHTDSANSVYLYFKNCFIEITKDEIKKHNYSEMNGYLWKGSIPSMNRNFIELTEPATSVYEQFVSNITSDKGCDGNFTFNTKAKKSAETIIGYLVSRYKKSSEAKAVLLTEKAAGAVEGSEATGGTGKGVFIQALEQFRVAGEIDGKDLRNEDRFAFSAFEDGQNIYVMQDVLQGFDLKSLYNKITNKFIVEKKCQNKRIIPFMDAPKVIITSNYILRGMDEGSTDRRLTVLELENYYNAYFSPANEFGCEFFSEDWDAEEWARFDNYIIHCVQEFLANGIINHTTEELEEKKKQASITGNIDVWFDDWCAGYTIGKGQYATSEKLNTSEFYSSTVIFKLYKEWCADSRISSNLNSNTFSKKLKSYLGDRMQAERTKNARGWLFLPELPEEEEEEAPF